LEKGATHSFTVTVTSGGNPVDNALVCVSRIGDGVYERAYTDANGEVLFSDVTFATSGTAPVVASKHNFFPAEEEIYIYISTGCPMLYVYDGQRYRFVNNILAASEEYSSLGSNVHERYPIYFAPLNYDGRLHLRIREDEAERSYIDNCEVSYITFSPRKRPVLTDRNEFRILMLEPLSPVSAVDQNGIDILGLLEARDGFSYSAYDPGYIIITYDISAAFPKPMGDGPGGGIDPGGDDKGQAKITTSNFPIRRSQKVMISVLDENGIWQDIDTRYPRIQKFDYYTDLSEWLDQPQLTVKISWRNGISVDAVPFYFFEEEPVAQNELSLRSASHSAQGDILTQVFYEDLDEAVLMPGEQIDLVFDPINIPQGQSVAVMMKLLGRYETITSNAPDGFVFEQNYPNPFNPRTNFNFSLPTTANVRLEVYNILGQRVITVIDGEYSAGSHSVSWDGQDERGNSLASGVYFSKFQAGDYSTHRKMVIVK
jgi:hypothetical protein